LIYNTLAFGGPLEWTYKHVAKSTFQQMHSVGYVGLTFPSPKIFWAITFGSSRGFFFYMPHLLFGIAGLIQQRRRPESLLALSIIGANFLLVSGLGNWEGGWTFGPRFLIPLIPFLIYGCALWLQQVQTNSFYFCAYLILLAFSTVSMIFAATTFPFAPPFPF